MDGKDKIESKQTLLTGRKRSVKVSNKSETHRPESLVKSAPSEESQVDNNELARPESREVVGKAPQSAPPAESKASEPELAVPSTEPSFKPLEFSKSRQVREYSSASPLSILLPRIGDLRALSQNEAFLNNARESLKDSSASRDRNPITERSMIQQVLNWLSMGERQ